MCYWSVSLFIELSMVSFSWPLTPILSSLRGLGSTQSTASLNVSSFSSISSSSLCLADGRSPFPLAEFLPLLATELRFLRKTVSLVWTQAESIIACNSSPPLFPSFSLSERFLAEEAPLLLYLSLLYFSLFISSAFLQASSIILCEREGSWLTMKLVWGTEDLAKDIERSGVCEAGGWWWLKYDLVSLVD